MAAVKKSGGRQSGTELSRAGKLERAYTKVLVSIEKQADVVEEHFNTPHTASNARAMASVARVARLLGAELRAWEKHNQEIDE